MPEITRYFPVSHDLNSDHEVWEMTDELGDRSLRVWLEILSIADRNGGVLPTYCQPLAKALAYRCHTHTSTVAKVWQHAVSRLWIVCDPVCRVRNYRKFHRTRSPNKTHNGKQLGTLHPNHPNLPNPHKNEEGEAPSPVKYEKGKEPWRPVANRIYKQDTERFKRIAAFINWCRHEDQNYTDEIIAKGFEKFEQALKDRLCDGDWWPYAEKLFKKAYTEDQQAQSAKHKDESARFIAHALKVAGK